MGLAGVDARLTLGPPARYAPAPTISPRYIFMRLMLIQGAVRRKYTEAESGSLP